jgi:hypothetical protein
MHGDASERRPTRRGPGISASGTVSRRHSLMLHGQRIANLRTPPNRGRPDHQHRLTALEGVRIL